MKQFKNQLINTMIQEYINHGIEVTPEFLEAFELGLLPVCCLFYQERRPYGAADFTVLRNDQGLVLKLLAEGGDNSFIMKDSASEDNLAAELSVAQYLREIVFGDGVGQAGSNYLQRHAFLLG